MRIDFSLSLRLLRARSFLILIVILVIGKKALAAKADAAAAAEGGESLTAGFDASILKLAQKQRMNTDVRRAIFCVLVTSDDYQDAFEHLMKLQLKNKQDREIVHVLLHCCQQEKEFNEYYALLAEKLCTFDHNYKETFKYALWDKLKQVDELASRVLANLAILFSRLILSTAMSLSALKIVDFEGLSAKGVRHLVPSRIHPLIFAHDLDCFLPDAVHKHVRGGLGGGRCCV